MSKEMMIVFVYDTECCQSEEDDPATAVLYFHPSWVSDHQRLALVGQLMGTTHFLGSVFTAPKMITLESGKFALRQFTSRYILAVGTDRNIADWVIDHRANILTSLIKLYHYNIDTIYQISSTKTFAEKLYQIFETYLPVLLFGGNTFANAPTMQLPKSASNVFLEAIQVLQCCQDVQGILGGVIFYHNKVIATQLNAEVTKLLVMTDPYRIKCTAESINLGFELPDGVQLLQVYINKKEHDRLKNTAQKYKNAFENSANKKLKKGFGSKSSTKDPVLSAMKRDKSIIFSTVPEEDSDVSPQPLTKKKFIERPRSLSLFSTTADVINNDAKKKPQTPFRSQASVCSTPITDKVLHGNVMSICNNPDEDELKPRSTPIEEIDITKKFTEIIKKDFEKKSATKIMQEFKNNLTKFSMTMKQYGIGLKSLPGTPKKVSGEDNQCTTITDPTFPVIGLNGLPISKCLYQEQVVDEKVVEEEKEIEPPPPKFEPPEFDKSEYKKRRHSLNLPLKSLTYDQDKPTSPVRKFGGGGVQLTPLLSKLTILALDERARDATPSFEFRDLSIPLFKKKCVEVEEEEAECDSLEKVTLFICGQQNMVLMVLIDNEPNEETVMKLNEICVSNLNQLESHVHQCIDPCSNAATDITVDPYSYMSLDQKWDVIQRGGPWGVSELSILTQLHNNFMDSRNLCEIIIRNDDSIIYGYRHSQTELFYHQNTTNVTAGLPTPADLMGTVPLKARRRLERDHAIILL